MKKACLNFSFDDGRIDNFTIAYPILKNYDLPATFNITTGYIKGVLPYTALGTAKPMTIEMVKELYSDKSIEIAGHGYLHRNTAEDIIQGIETLCDELGTDTLCDGKCGFASPGTALDLNYYNSIKAVLEHKNIQYVRLSLRYLGNAKLKTYYRKASRLIKLPILYRLAYQDTLMDSINNDIIYSVPILSSITISELDALIKNAINEKKALVMMFHSIVDDKMRDNWDFPKDRFEQLCKLIATYQKLGKLEVSTTMKIYNELKR